MWIKRLKTGAIRRLAYAIGVVNTDLHQARDTGSAFGDVVERKHRRRR